MVRVLPFLREPEPEAPSYLEAAQWLPDDASYVTETLPLAGTGDRLPAGVGQVLARQPAESIGVRNLGTVDLIVNLGPARTNPALIGPGAVLVPSGVFTVLRMPGTMHSFYGRPGELVEVTRYPTAVAPVTVNGARRYLPVDCGAAVASGMKYTTPWGTPALLGGFGARETSGAAAAVFRIRDGSSTGTVLETISLTANESTSDEDEDQLCSSSGLYVEVVSGTIELQLRVN